MMELQTSFALELPCVFTTSPFKPRRGAPPYSLASNPFIVFLRAGLIKRAPIFVRKSCINPSLIFSISTPPTPSNSFSMIFPANASHTMTSASPYGIFLASMLPVKLISLHSFKSGNVSFTSAFPFSSSAPIFTIATFGFLIPITCSM